MYIPELGRPVAVADLDQKLFDGIRETFPDKTVYGMWPMDLNASLQEGGMLLSLVEPAIEQIIERAEDHFQAGVSRIHIDASTQDVAPGKSQRMSGWHTDGLMPAYIASDDLATEFITQAEGRSVTSEALLELGLHKAKPRAINSVPDFDIERAKELGIEIFQGKPRQLIEWNGQFHRSAINQNPTSLQKTVIRFLPILFPGR